MSLEISLLVPCVGMLTVCADLNAIFYTCHDRKVSCHDVQNSGAIIYWKLDENKLNIPSNLNYGGETFLNFSSFV